MAYYNNRQQYTGGPQNPSSQVYHGQERYDLQPQRSHDPPYSQQNGRAAQFDYQYEDTYGGNQQYTERYAPNHQQQRFDHVQHAQTMGPVGAGSHGYADYQRPDRTYQYDERYRSDSRDPAPRGDRNQPSARRSPPQMRPGTSASDRRQKDRILDSKNGSPKAVPWDNPFGVFPGTKKDVEERKKKQDSDQGDRSTSGTPSSLQQPMQVPPSPRRPTTGNSDGPRIKSQTNYDGQRPSTAHARKPLQSGARIPSAGSHEKSFGQAPSGNPAFHEQSRQGRDVVDHYGVPHNGNTMLSLPERPIMNRSASGPNPQLQPLMNEDVSNQAKHQDRDQSRRYFSDGSEQNKPQDYNDDQYHSPTMDFGTWQKLVQQPGLRSPTTDAGPRGQQPAQNQSGPAAPSSRGYGELAPVRSGPADLNNQLVDPGLPNFASRPPDMTGSTDRKLTVQTTAPYRKPTFGQDSSRPGLNLRSPVEDSAVSANSDRSVWSPAQDGGYDDQHYRTQSREPQPRIEPNPSMDNRNGPPQLPRQNTGKQFEDYPNSQRLGSQSDMRNARPANSFPHPYNKPPTSQQRPLPEHSAPRQRPPHIEQPQSPQYGSRQDYGFDERGYPIDYSNDRKGSFRNAEPFQNTSRPGQPQQHPGVQRTYTAPVDEYQHDQYNHGYHQDPRTNGQPGRVGPRRDFSPQTHPQAPAPSQQGGQFYDQNGYADPPRPRTANSTRTPIRQTHEALPFPSQPPAGLPDSDRAHPMPVRPGLMMPAPSPAPMQKPVARVSEQNVPPNAGQQRPQNLPQPSAPRGNPPVTIKELNELREAFKNRPNDAQLGLRFAKKLVEAARVLSSEGGRADAKQTAKNRERYINDAHKIVKKLVAAGSPEAMFYLADCYGQGQLGLEVDAKEAFALYTSAAKIGHAQSAYRVAVCCELGYQEGGGTRRDHVKAVQFYKRAATLGDAPAMYKMGMVLFKGLLGQQPNPREGISWLKRAAERADEENPHALHELGLLYESAKSTDVILRDEAYALQLFISAAKLGYKYSQHRLGSAYEYGSLGCPIDPRQSIHWYSEAAKQQEHQSEFALSGWYLTGSPPLLEQSDTEAYLWARKAATSGLGKAEYAMGYYSEVGIGTNADVEEAKKWYFRAAAQGDMRARERLEELKRGAGRRKRDRVSRSDVSRKNEGECNVM